MAKIKIRAKEMEGMVLCNTDKSPRSGSAFSVITGFLEEHGKEITFEELVDIFQECYTPRSSTKEVDETAARGYVRGAYSEGYIQEFDDSEDDADLLDDDDWEEEDTNAELDELDELGEDW